MNIIIVHIRIKEGTTLIIYTLYIIIDRNTPSLQSRSVEKKLNKKMAIRPKLKLMVSKVYNINRLPALT